MCGAGHRGPHFLTIPGPVRIQKSENYTPMPGTLKIMRLTRNMDFHLFSLLNGKKEKENREAPVSLLLPCIGHIGPPIKIRTSDGSLNAPPEKTAAGL